MFMATAVMKFGRSVHTNFLSAARSPITKAIIAESVGVVTFEAIAVDSVIKADVKSLRLSVQCSLLDCFESSITVTNESWLHVMLASTATVTVAAVVTEFPYRSLAMSRMCYSTILK